MKFADYRAKLDQDPEYQQAQAELQAAFTLGNAVLRARLEKGWSQAELARRVGTRQANISRIEAGLANPTLRLIQELCAVLDLVLLILPRTGSPGLYSPRQVHLAPAHQVSESKPDSTCNTSPALKDNF